MLSVRDMATLRGALLFWHEEIAIHDADTARLYLEPADLEPLTLGEVAALRERLTGDVRYLLLPLDAACEQQLLTAEELAARGHGEPVATLILPR